MLTSKQSDRALPTFISLLVIGVLLMTFDVRLEGGGVVGVLRSGTQAIVSPMQRIAAFAVTPIANALDSLSNVASLREQNAALSAQLAESQAALVAVQDDLAKLDLLEQIYDLETDGAELGQTVANVIGSVDAALIIDKGISNGVLVGQPVIDTNGYVIGTVKSASSGSATVLPITASRDGLTVLVGSQTGTLVTRPFSSDLGLEMDLDVFDAREPVLAGDRVLTSAASTDYPAGLPVGEVIEDASPESTSLTTTVRPFVDPEALRFVVVLAWPPDPVSAATDDTIPESHRNDHRRRNDHHYYHPRGRWLMRGRTALVIGLTVVIAVVIQTTLFGRLRVVTPDLVMLIGIMLALTRVRTEAVLGVAFLSGLIMDLLGASLIGLRAVVYTTVAYIAIRTKERAELGRVTIALWAGLLTLLGVVLILLIGTLFGQAALLGEGAVSVMILVPLANVAVAALLAPTFVRLVDRDRTALRYP